MMISKLSKGNIKLMVYDLRHHKLILLMLCLILTISACGPAQQLTLTSLPTITPISGWHKLSNDGFEIWLPESFIGGTNLDFDEVAQQMAKLGPDFEKQANALKDKGSSFTIFAFDKNRSKPGLVTNIIVAKESVPGNISVEKYVETLASRLAKPFEVVETKSLDSNRYQIGVLMVRASTPQTGDVSQVAYAIKNGGAVWQLVFTTPSNEFQERLSIFEEIVKTVNVPFIRESTTRQGNPIIFGIGVAMIIISLLFRFLQMRQRRK